MIFDTYIAKLGAFADRQRVSGKRITAWRAPIDVEELLSSLPVRFGAGANPGVVLRGDTYLELGNPEAGSAEITVFTENVNLISDGKITLIGPDLGEVAGASLPFGQITILGGRSLCQADHDRLHAAGIVGDRIEGYMVRSVPNAIWSRISKAAAAKGFCFEALGRALMALYRANCPDIEAIAIVFVTSGADAVAELGSIAAQVREIRRELVREKWAIRGYVIECATGCSNCGDKRVCDDIREVLKMRLESRAQRATDA